MISLDDTLQKIAVAANYCFDLNADGRLSLEDQTVFYQFGQHIVLLQNQMLTDYDRLKACFEEDQTRPKKLRSLWNDANSALKEAKKKPIVSKKYAAHTKTASAIDVTSTEIQCQDFNSPERDTG
jgi:hypothetical protein